MKTKTFIYILILICIIKSHAQDYQSLNSVRISFFSKQYYSIKCIKIDSVRYETDSVLYPFSNLRKLDYFCYTPYGFSWIGRKIIIQKDGMNVFFNKDNDSIKIKTNAKPNESWIAYKIPDSTTVVAKVISIDTLKFLNLIDSVKTISFQAYNKAMEPIDYEINNLSLALSKNYGFIKTVNFSLFPNLEDDNQDDNKILNYDLIGLSNPKVGVQNLTWLDVYDFQVGDELHILYKSSDLFYDTYGFRSYATTTKTKLKYIERSDYKDSVVYRIEREESIFEQIEKKDSTRFVYVHDTIQATYNSYPSFDKLPGEPVIYNYESYTNSMYNGDFVSKTTPYERYYGNSEFACWSPPISDGCFPDLTYVKGLGGPYYSCTSSAFSLSSVDNSLAYYKKANITGGTPLTITDVKNIISEKNINVYPNPAIDVLFVRIGIQDTPCFFELSDMYGKLRLKTEIKSIENSIHLNNIENGVYIYKVVQKGITIKTGKLIKINASR